MSCHCYFWWCWWSLNNRETVTAVHTASFIFLFFNVLTFCVFLLPSSSLLCLSSSQFFTSYLQVFLWLKGEVFQPVPVSLIMSMEISQYSRELLIFMVLSRLVLSLWRSTLSSILCVALEVWYEPHDASFINVASSTTLTEVSKWLSSIYKVMVCLCGSSM